ncbi:hypothetical protein X801_10079 [Opisthorchis viverrini]|uniref:ADF-H domain-containing protein n=1 Tax=Opisthorchis viverrini TaxID=6198 RepID=A0A1S8WI80_OPIVI|nr:hypothetical protein X801_10079 [Opisthorchis viverrini]
MLYASTRATLRRQFGDHLIKEDLTGNAFSDVDLNGFEKHLTSKESPAPLTAAEIEKASNLNNEVSGGFYAARPTGSSLQFGLTNGAAAELQRFARGLCNYVQLKISQRNGDTLIQPTTWIPYNCRLKSVGLLTDVAPAG